MNRIWVILLFTLILSACTLSSGVGVTSTPISLTSTLKADARKTQYAVAAERVQANMTTTMFSLILTSQAPTLTPTLTLTPSLSPTITLTPTPPTPPPLSMHEWLPEPLLLVFDDTGSNGGYPPPPDILLYADGQLIVNYYGVGNKSGRWHTQLSRGEVCQVLNTIEQTGFLNFDPTSYNFVPLGGGPTTHIVVDAWRSTDYWFSHLVDLMGNPGFVDGYLQGCDFCPIPYVSPAITETYLFLSNYKPPRLKKYVSETWALSVYEYLDYVPENFDQESAPWTLDNPGLIDTLQSSGCRNSGTITTFDYSMANQIFEMLDLSFEGYFTEGGRKFQVNARSMYPYEVLPQCGTITSYGIPQVEIPNLARMSCYVEDGTLPIPTPTLMPSDTPAP